MGELQGERGQLQQQTAPGLFRKTAIFGVFSAITRLLSPFGPGYNTDTTYVISVTGE